MVPLGSGDTSHIHSESTNQQPISGISTYAESTIETPSGEVKESTNSKLSSALEAWKSLNLECEN